MGRYFAISVETSRLARVFLDKRTCKIYTNTVKGKGSEIHVLFTCDLHADLREVLLKKIIEVIPEFVNMLILDELKNSFNIYHKEITRFISNTYSFRSKIYNDISH